jgi:hypothetical protein
MAMFSAVFTHLCSKKIVIVSCFLFMSKSNNNMDMLKFVESEGALNSVPQSATP